MLKKNILVQGWFDLPHSYSIVNCNQLYALYKEYNNEYTFYIQQMEYPDIYKGSWKGNQSAFHNQEMAEFLNTVPRYTPAVNIDLIYRITYQYDISIYNSFETRVPILVFYTAEHACLDVSYFKIINQYIQMPQIIDDDFIKQYLQHYTNFHFVCPSSWNVDAMKKYTDNVSYVIPHGIDPQVFKNNQESKVALREKYNIKENDLLFLQMGSMTSNKGIFEMLAALCVIVNAGHTQIKLMLKGIQELYQSKEFLRQYKSALVEHIPELTKEQVDHFFKHHVLFFQNTLSTENLASFYNCSDVYISPYKAEGFNMTVLEALSCNTNVIVSHGGCTDDFVDPANCEDSGIYLLNTTLVKDSRSGHQELSYNINNLIQLVLENLENFKSKGGGVEKRIKFIHENYSWSCVARQYHELFQKLI